MPMLHAVPASFNYLMSPFALVFPNTIAFNFLSSDFQQLSRPNL